MNFQSCGAIESMWLFEFGGGICGMVEVQFYDSVDDSLLRFAVIISKAN